jgi:hypothetical protein
MVQRLFCSCLYSRGIYVDVVHTLLENLRINNYVTEGNREKMSGRACHKTSVVCYSDRHESRKRTSLDHYYAQKHTNTNLSLFFTPLTQISYLRIEKRKTPFHMQEKISSPLPYHMYLHSIYYIASHPHPSPSPLSQATKLSLLISLLTNTPLSSPSLGCRRCEKIGNSYFVPGCSSLRLGSKRRKNAIKGRVGDAGESEWLKWVVMAGDVEALEHVARELFFMLVFHSKRGLLFYGSLTFPSLQPKKISSTVIFWNYHSKALLVAKTDSAPTTPETPSPTTPYTSP